MKAARWTTTLVALACSMSVFAADPKNAEELILADRELATLRFDAERLELTTHLYAELGAAKFLERYQSLSSAGGVSEPLDTGRALELIAAQCRAPTCDVVRKIGDELRNRIALLRQAEALKPALPAAEDEIRAKACKQVPCAFALAPLGDLDGQQVHIISVSTADLPQLNFYHRYMGRVFVRAGQIVRVEKLVSSRYDDCTGEPHCVSADYLQTLEFDPVSKTISSSHQFNRNTWEYKFRIFPDVRPLHAEEQHWGFEKYDDPETAWGTGLVRDWVSGYTSDLGLAACSAAANSPSPSGGYVVPLNIAAPRDWRREVPARSAAIHVPKPHDGPPEGFLIPARARIDPAVWFSVAALDPRTLWVEVHDPSMHVQATEWLQRSHLEVWNWTRPKLTKDGDCLSFPWLKGGSAAPDAGENTVVAAPPQQWAIELDGQGVHVGFGSLPAQAVAVEAFRLGASAVRLKIVLPEVPPGADPNGRRVAIAYSVSDGRKQLGLLVTSALRRADPTTFSWIGDLGQWF